MMPGLLKSLRLSVCSSLDPIEMQTHAKHNYHKSLYSESFDSSHDSLTPPRVRALSSKVGQTIVFLQTITRQHTTPTDRQ